MNAVALGLGAALCWGIADVLARFATRELGAYRSLLYAQLVGLVALSAYAGATGELARVAAGAPPAAWGWALATGVLFTGAALAFYRALETGVLALVSPITASYAAVTVLLALASGEALTAPRALGLAAAIVGVTLASIPPAAPAPAARVPDEWARDGAPPRAPRLDAGVRWALAAALGFGLTFWLLGFRVTPAFGGLGSVWVLRAAALVVLLVAARPAGVTLRPPSARAGWLVVGVGVLDTLAFAANNVGTTRGLVSVVSVLGSLFSAVTVLLA
jgi:drug/metabolite transporter (DMT)-like permease